MDKKEIAVLEKKATPLVTQAETLIISSEKDMKVATEVLSSLNAFHDQVVAKREEITKPLNAALLAARGMFSPIEKPTKAAIDLLRQKIGAYQTAEARRVREEEEKLAARVGEGKGKFKLETADRKASEIERPKEAIHTEVGALKFRTDKKLKITDEKKIPREFLIVDEKALFAALKEGQKVAGAEIEEIQVPVNSRG